MPMVFRKAVPITGISVFIVLVAFLIGCSGENAEGPAEVETGGGLPIAPENGQEPELVEWNGDGIFSDNEYLGEMKYGSFEIRWRSDGDYLYLGITADTSGWISVGFEPSVAMKDADMIFGAVADGTVIVSDQYSTGSFGPHSADSELGGSDDVLEYGGTESGGTTTIEVKRRLNTGDAYDYVFAGGTVNIIWGYSSSDDFTRQHSNRGSGEIQL